MVFAMQAIGEYKESGQASSLKLRDYKYATDLIIRGGGGDLDNVKTVVRRLTPLECERLQGLPDNWTLIGEKDGDDYYYIDTDGKRRKVTDSARYKALGNGLCTPFWEWLARRICAQYERTVTLGSLFDGISCFCYVFDKVGAVPVWSSEIEEFPIAVAKAHFPDERSDT